MNLFCSGIWSGSGNKKCQKFKENGEVWSHHCDTIMPMAVCEGFIVSYLDSCILHQQWYGNAAKLFSQDGQDGCLIPDSSAWPISTTAAAVNITVGDAGEMPEGSIVR